MRAVALLHPDASVRAIEPFQHVNPDLIVQEQFGDLPQTQAALIFGGDGTVHRHLPELSKYKTPTLVVPSGSGNDFAKAIGIRNAKVALEAWQRFCAGRENTREIDLGLIRSGTGSETLFCCVAAIGMDAQANRLANAMPGWIRRRGGYVVAALCSLALFKACRFNVMALLPKRSEGNATD